MHFHCSAAAGFSVGAAILFSSVAHAADSALSLSQAQRIAVERSRQLAAHDASIQSSRQMAIAAGQLPDPVLRLGIDNLPIEGADRFTVSRDFMTMRRIGVMQEFTGADKRRLKSARFEREADRAAAEKDAALAAVQRDTATAWLDVLYLERRRALIAEEGQEVRLEIEATESAYRAGRGNQADALTAHSARVMLEDRLAILDRRLRSSRAVLTRWVGEKFGSAPLSDPPALDSAPIHMHSLEEQLQRHPEIVAMSEEVAVLETEVALARANKRSDWTWELMYQERGSDFSDMVGIGVSIPLQWDQTNRQDRDIASKLALADKAKGQRDEALRAHVAEVQTMFDEWKTGRERLRRYERELIPLARDRTQAVVSAYRGARTDLPAVIAARRNELEARTQALEIEADTARTWAQLRYLYPDDFSERAAQRTLTSPRAASGVSR